MIGCAPSRKERFAISANRLMTAPFWIASAWPSNGTNRSPRYDRRFFDLRRLKARLRAVDDVDLSPQDVLLTEGRSYGLSGFVTKEPRHDRGEHTSTRGFAA